jgi:hypothetical protein
VKEAEQKSVAMSPHWTTVSVWVCASPLTWRRRT